MRGLTGISLNRMLESYDIACRTLIGAEVCDRTPRPVWQKVALCLEDASTTIPPADSRRRML